MRRLKQTQLTYGVPPASSRKQQLADLSQAQSPLLRLRDGEVVLYRRIGTRAWQCRYRLKEHGWIRRSTKTANTETAAQIACEWYDEARFRLRAGLAPEVKRFKDVASLAVHEMRRDLAAGTGKRVFVDYCRAIEQHFIPYFGNTYLANISHSDVQAFEAWRNQQIRRTPATSTLLTYASAWTRINAVAVQRGWISANTPVPKLTVVGGRRSQSRPAFREEEVEKIRAFMKTWCSAAKQGKTAEMRLMLRDYVELLLYTGMRHGTEAMRVEWRHCEWYTDTTKIRYLRMWVSGKTGERWLIAKHDCVEVLRRIAARDQACEGMTLDEVLAARLPLLLFRFSTGEKPYHFNKVFERMLADADLLKDANGQRRTLYSLRHTYATFELRDGTDIHTLARQMGTSVLMLEMFYSKVDATLTAKQLAR